MELQGEQLIHETPDKVWRGLNDPLTLKACINGCESIEAVSDTEFKVVIKAAVGPVKARFTGSLTLRDVVPPKSYSLALQGNGGVAGFGKGEAAVSLNEADEGTLLTYVVNVQVGGKLAQIGSRLIDGVARKLAGDFFTAFDRLMTEPEPLQEIEEAGLDSQLDKSTTS
jgi:carbon monoxide dehydrogenase subunit G